MLRTIALTALLTVQAWAAISTSTAWEVRPTVGTDTNGGGFVQGATGTDRSQADTPFCTAADLAVTVTAATSATCPFSAASVGNIINISAGGCTSGFYQVVSVAVATATLDRTAGTSTGCTFALGGALATLTKALTGNTIGNIIFIKATGTLQSNASINFNNNVAPIATTPPNQVIGYTTARTDGGRATIQAITNSNIVLINAAGQAGWFFRNLVIDCNSLANCQGMTLGYYTWVTNTKITNFTAFGVSAPGVNFTTITDSEVTGGASCAGAVHWSNSNGGAIARNYIHDNACFGVDVRDGSQVLWNLITNNSGASSDGITLASDCLGCVIFGNTIYGSGRDGINLSGSADMLMDASIRNNILVNSGRYGINGASAAGWAAFSRYDGNAYFNNTTANRHFMDDTGGTNPINAAAPYTNTLDIILSADPFTNAAGGDFTLNSTAGGGAALKGTGTPGVLPGATGQGYMDLGAFQVQAGGGGGSPCVSACAK